MTTSQQPRTSFGGIIRAFEPHHATDETYVLQLLLDLQAHEMALHPSRRAWTIDDARAYWLQTKERLTAQNGICLLAVEDDGRVIGISMGWVQDDIVALKLHEKDRRYGTLGDGYVLKEYRRAGVYSLLVEAMEKHFLSCGVGIMRRNTFANNSGLLAAANMQGYELFEITLEKSLD